MPKGHFERTDEHRKNIGKALKGRVFSEKTLAIMSAQRKGRKMSDEARRKMSEARKGKPSGRVFTEEMSLNMSKARKGKSGKLDKYGVTAEEYQKRIALGEKWCVFRKHFALSSEFPPPTHNSSVCSACIFEYRRRNNLRKCFGVDHEWYELKLSEQGGGCGICGSTDVKGSGGRHFGVDHCHATGRVRGLLCFLCNAALERVEAVPNWGVVAMAYLERYAVERISENGPIHSDHRKKRRYVAKVDSGGIV